MIDRLLKAACLGAAALLVVAIWRDCSQPLNPMFPPDPPKPGVTR